MSSANEHHRAAEATLSRCPLPTASEEATFTTLKAIAQALLALDDRLGTLAEIVQDGLRHDRPA